MRVWSMFSGAGGLDLGMQTAGAEPELVIEVENVFCQTLSRNLPAAKILQRDIRHVSARDLVEVTGARDVDLMIGGPPCQSFSTGGGRAGLTDPRGNLIFEYLRLVKEVQPQAFILENVANLITAALRHRPIQQRPGRNWNLLSYSTRAANGASSSEPVPPLAPDELSGSAISYLLEQVLDRLKYSFSLAVVDSAEYGAAQHRLRFVLIGVREGKAPKLSEPGFGVSGVPYRTLQSAIADLVDHPGPGSAYTPEVKRIFDLVPPGGNWRSLPPDIARMAMGERSYAAGGGKTGFFRRLAWDKPAPTVTGRANRKGSAMCHPSVSRPLSVWECKRVQGFPDDWAISGSTSDQYLQVGNAVPVALGEAVGNAVIGHLHGGGEVETRSIDQMLAHATAKLRATARNGRRGATLPT